MYGNDIDVFMLLKKTERFNEKLNSFNEKFLSIIMHSNL